ncbi:MAG: response regulator [Nitrospirota bacterium]
MEDFKVLIVDDEKEFLETIVKRLQKRNLYVEGVDSGEKAVESITRGNFDVVLLDVKMPGMDGVETLREIKKLKPLTEVVMLTGHASVESGIEGMKLGAFDYLMKPMELEQLFEKLKDAYEKRRLQELRIEEAKVRHTMMFPPRGSA